MRWCHKCGRLHFGKCRLGTNWCYRYGKAGHFHVELQSSWVKALFVKGFGSYDNDIIDNRRVDYDGRKNYVNRHIRKECHCKEGEASNAGVSALTATPME
jgi:hypothetical protein